MDGIVEIEGRTDGCVYPSEGVCGVCMRTSVGYFDGRSSLSLKSSVMSNSKLTEMVETPISASNLGPDPVSLLPRFLCSPHETLRPRRIGKRESPASISVQGFHIVITVRYLDGRARSGTAGRRHSTLAHRSPQSGFWRLSEASVR